MRSKYATKRASGNMMYGPAPKRPAPKDVPYVPRDRYWWGELRSHVKNVNYYEFPFDNVYYDCER